jgi:lysophospholipase L1-like esterase
MQPTAIWAGEANFRSVGSESAYIGETIYMKPYLFLLFVFFILVACKNEVVQPTATTPPPTETDEALRYLALGDSYTIGQDVQASERYPVQLAAALQQQGIAVAPPTIIATTGWTTADLKKGIERANIQDTTYDMVSLLIGVNNQYQGRSLEEYRREFRELLLTSIAFAGGNKNKVFVLSIPDYGYTPFGASRQESISTDIDQFNAANQQITDSLGIRYFDITPISRRGLAEPDLVAGDGLHPSGKMYGLWVDEILSGVKDLIALP